MAEPKKRGNKWHGLVYDYTDPKTGKRKYKSITAATKAEWYMELAEFEKERALSLEERAEKASLGITVGEAVDRYIEMCEGILAPSTIAGYRRMQKYGFPHFMDTPVKQLTNESVQLAIREEFKREPLQKGTENHISAKTVHHEWGLISSALKDICHVHFDVRLPKIERKEKVYPHPAELLRAISGSPVELFCLISMWLTYSTSEIRGFNCSSVRGGMLHVDKVVVKVDGVDIPKITAKTDLRKRSHVIPAYIMQLIEAQPNYRHYIETGEDSPLIPYDYNQIYGYFKRTMRKHGYDLSLHDLRHMAASIMAMLNTPEKYALERGGWKTPHVMKSVYQHTFSEERRAADARVDEFFNNILKRGC